MFNKFLRAMSLSLEKFSFTTPVYTGTPSVQVEHATLLIVTNRSRLADRPESKRTLAVSGDPTPILPASSRGLGMGLRDAVHQQNRQDFI